VFWLHSAAFCGIRLVPLSLRLYPAMFGCRYDCEDDGLWLSVLRAWVVQSCTLLEYVYMLYAVHIVSCLYSATGIGKLMEDLVCCTSPGLLHCAVIRALVLACHEWISSLFCVHGWVLYTRNALEMFMNLYSNMCLSRLLSYTISVGQLVGPSLSLVYRDRMKAVENNSMRRVHAHHIAFCFSEGSSASRCRL